MKIEAAIRLRATSKNHLIAHALMAKSTPITKLADAGIKEISRQMMLREYTVDTKQTRAFYTTTFAKEDAEGMPYVFQLVGWHGNGHYGDEKTVLEFYDDSTGRKPIITIGSINEDSLTEEKQQDLINKILAYIKKHA